MVCNLPGGSRNLNSGQRVDAELLSITVDSGIVFKFFFPNWFLFWNCFSALIPVFSALRHIFYLAVSVLDNVLSTLIRVSPN